MWGLGATIGPYAMGISLPGGRGSNIGYCYISLLQIALTLILLISLPLWRLNNHTKDEQKEDISAQTLTL